MSKRTALAILTAAALTCLAACAGPPSKGPIKQATLNHDQNQISITAKGPYDNIQPRAVVGGFLAATAGDDGDPAFQVAQQFMADGVGKAWIGDKRIAAGDTIVYAESQPRFTGTSIMSPDGTTAAVASNSGGGLGQTTTVTATVTQIAVLRDGGFYHSTTPTSMQVTFKLGRVKVGPGAGVQWRITEPPAGPDGSPQRLISVADLRRAYQALPVFEPVAGGTSLATATVDQIYVMPSDALRTYEALVRALLFCAGSKDPAQVGFDQTKVRVVLAGLPKPAAGRPVWSSGTLTDALVSTFQAATPYLQLSGNTPPPAMLSLRVGQTETTSQIVPPTSVRYPPVYFAAGGSVKATDGQASDPTPSPAKTVLDGGALPARYFGKIAVRQEKVGGGDGSQSPESAPIRIAALVTKGTGVGDVAVYSNLDPARNNVSAKPVAWYHAADPNQVSDLTWDPVDGSLWVVDAGNLYDVPAPQNGTSQAPVLVQQLDTGPYQRIRLSPDGQQAVVVTGSEVDKPSSDSPTVAVLTKIVRPDAKSPAGGGPSGLQLMSQHRIQPTTVDDAEGKPLHISDVAWAGGRTIVLLAKEQGSGQGAAPPKLYKVYADGSQDTHLADGVEQSEGPATTRITAVVSDTGGSQMRIFSNGVKVDDPAPGAIYWKGKTFDFFDVGDNPVMATRMVAGS